MKIRFSHSSNLSGGARPRTLTESSHVVRRLVFAFLAAATLFPLPRAIATSVVALVDKTTHRVVIAADCRVNRQLASVSQCKIIDKPGCTVAMAGLYEEKATAFHLRQLVDAACEYPGDLRAKAEAFLRFSRTPYERAIRRIRDEDPSAFARPVENKATEVIFAGIQNGQIALIIRGLVVNSAGKVSAERFESTAPRYSQLGYFIGLNGHIRRYVKAHPEWITGDYVKLARQFVEMEVEAHPDLAGPPISELQIDKDGHVNWLDKGACDSGRSAGTTRETIEFWP
jgi:hypothetical protein